MTKNQTLHNYSVSYYYDSCALSFLSAITAPGFMHVSLTSSEFKVHSSRCACAMPDAHLFFSNNAHC